MSEISPTERLTAFGVILPPRFLPWPLEPGKLYVVKGTQTTSHAAAFLCPCGCGKEVYLPCRAPGTPHGLGSEWELTLHDDNTVTLHPSILDRGTCQSHYWIKRNQVEWC